MKFLLRRTRSAEVSVRPKSRTREWCESMAFTIVFVWVFTNGIAQATEVPTESMKPAILAGDHFFLDKVAFPANYPKSVQKYLPARSIRRGDIVAFWSPEDRSLRLVKRVIAVPGETVEIRERQVFINGAPLNEPYKVHIDPNVYARESWAPQSLQQRDNFGPAVVPPGQYFMMGDNRDNSNDSRFWGFARREDFIGKPTFIYWSFEVDPDDAVQHNLKELAGHYVSVAEHFFSKTRWFRTGAVLR